MPVALFPRCCAKFGLCTRTYAQEIEKRSVKNNSSMHRNGGKLRGVLSAEPALMFRAGLGTVAVTPATTNPCDSRTPASRVCRSKRREQPRDRRRKDDAGKSRAS